ncbi:MAG: DmsE family decaheme c-type cytochrome [Elusimicrobiota bacterium]
MRRRPRVSCYLAVLSLPILVAFACMRASALDDGDVLLEEPEAVGASTCMGCHSDKEGFAKTTHGRILQGLKKTGVEGSCEACHGLGSLHAAAAGDATNPGFPSVSFFKSKTPGAIDAVCLTCHQSGKRMHWPGGAHQRNGLSCLSCHSVHHSKSQPLLNKASQVKTCARCHSQAAGKMKKSFSMPLADGGHGCASCHQPHGTTTKKLLVRGTVNETCYSCHAGKRGPFLWEHAPARQDCLLCHDQHGSSNHAMLDTRLPLLCQKCHQKGSFHSTGKLFSGDDVSKKSVFLMNKSCVNCHSLIHGSSHPSGKGLTR